MAKSPPSKDPRYRPFRVAAYGVYLAVVIAFSLCVVVSVAKSVLAMTPRVPPSEGEALAIPECLHRAQSLFDELDQRRRAFSQAKNGDQLALDWASYRVDWLSRLRQTQSRCAADEPGRQKLGKVFHTLERVEDLYTTSAVQYGGEIAPAVGAFRKAIADER